MAVTVGGGAPSAPQTADFRSTFGVMALSMAALSVRANATNATASGTDVAAGTDGHVLRRSGTSLGFGTLAAGAFGANTIPLTAVANITAHSVLANATGSGAAPTAVALAASQLFGRGDSGSLAPITLGTNLSMSGTTLNAAGGGGGVSDGDKGDITVTATGATWTIDAGVVTLAKMADLAQDQFIGRISASTGVPETATITAAARTVLDDTSVANMVNTLGGASSSGSGGLARVNGSTFNAPTITGVTTYSGASNFLETALGNFEAHTADGPQLTSTMTANASLTFDATPPDGRVFGPIRVPANAGGPYTLTIPSSVNATTGATITTVPAPASGQVELTFRRIGGVNYVYGVPSAGSGSVTLADITDMSANARTFNAAADYSAMRTALGVAIGSNVQAYNSNLAAIVGLSPSNDDFLQRKSGAWANRTVAQVATDLAAGGLATKTKTVGTGLGTTGSVALDLAALTDTIQAITASGNITFTTSNRASGRAFELRIAAGGSTRTLAWPAGWVAYGAALPTSLASGRTLRVAVECFGTADTDIDATTALSV